MKQLEIERKFLLRPCLPKRFLHAHGLAYRKYIIQQYYLPKQNGVYIRYRRKNSNYFKTIKSGEGMVREEQEHTVSKEEFEAHLKEHIGNIIEKERFVFLYRGITYELDRFRGRLKGLCYLEIEFDDTSAAEQFVLPPIFSPLYLAEVTDDKRFTNASISKSPTIPALDKSLERPAKKVARLLTPEEADSRGLFEPYESTGEALKAILQNLAAALEDRRKILKKDSSDPEVLHHFRVALRKMMSILELFKELFLPFWYQIHHRNLSALMRQTNVKRDMDVLLEKIPVYRSLLPRKLRDGLVPLSELLKKKKEALATHTASLAESELLLYEIASFAQPNLLEEETAQPIVITAMQILRKQSDKIIKKGGQLNAQSGEKAYHKLRIRFKKIRYFIEVLKPLIVKKRYRDTMEIIKELQRILGDFHDYQVQRRLLLSLVDNPALQQKKTRKAIDKVIKETGRLEEEQEKLFRKKFKKMVQYEKRFRHLFEVY